MKRYVTTVGAGLSLLIGVSGSLVLFPNLVKARTFQPAGVSQLALASHSQAIRLASVATTSRDLRASQSVRTAVHAKQPRGSMTRRAYGTLGQRVHTGVIVSSAAAAARYGSLARTAPLSQYMSLTRAGTSSGIRYGMLYRAGRGGLYTGRMQTATGRTDHRCTGM